MSDPVTNPTTPVTETPSYYNYAKAVMNGYDNGDILHDAAKEGLEVKMPSLDAFSKRVREINPKADDKSISDYYTSVSKDYLNYKEGNYNSFLDTNFNWLPDTKFNRKQHPERVGTGTVTPMSTDPMYVQTEQGAFATKTFDQAETSSPVFKDGGLWRPIADLEKTGKYLVGKDGDGINTPYHYWETADSADAYLDPERLRTVFGDRTQSSSLLGTIGRSLWSGSVPLLSKGVGGIIGGAGDLYKVIVGQKDNIWTDEVSNTMFNWGNYQTKQNEDEHIGGSAFLWGVGNIAGMILTGMALSPVIGAVGEGMGLGAGASEGLLEGSEFTTEQALKTAGKVLSKSPVEKMVERVNLGLTAAEIASGTVEKMNAMGIKDPLDRTEIYLPTLIAMYGSMALMPAKIIPGMYGAQQRAGYMADLDKIFGSALDKEASKATDESVGSKIAGWFGKLPSKIKSTAEGGPLGKLAMTPVETAGAVGLMGVSNAAIQYTYNTIKSAQSKNTMSKLGSNKYTEALEEYGKAGEDGKRPSHMVYYKTTADGLKTEVDYDDWYAEQQDIASAQNFISGTGKFNPSDELDISGMAAPMVASLLSVGLGELFNAFKTKNKKAEEKTLTSMAIRFVQNPKDYVKFKDMLTRIDLGKRYVDGNTKDSKIITADQDGKVPSHDAILKKNLVDRLDYKMELIARNLLDLTMVAEKPFELESETAHKTVEILKGIDEETKKLGELNGVPKEQQDSKAIETSQKRLEELNAEKDYLMKPKDPDNGIFKSNAYIDHMAAKHLINENLDIDVKEQAKKELKSNYDNDESKIPVEEISKKAKEIKNDILSNKLGYNLWYMDHLKHQSSDLFKMFHGKGFTNDKGEVTHEGLESFLKNYADKKNAAIDANADKSVGHSDFKTKLENIEKRISDAKTGHFNTVVDEQGNVNWDKTNYPQKPENYKSDVGSILTDIHDLQNTFKHTEGMDKELSDRFSKLKEKFTDATNEHLKHLSALDESGTAMGLQDIYERGIIPNYQKSIADIDFNEKVQRYKPLSELTGQEKEDRYNEALKDFVDNVYHGSNIEQWKKQVDDEIPFTSAGDTQKVVNIIEDNLRTLKSQLRNNVEIFQDKLEKNKDTNNYSLVHDYPTSRISKGNYETINTHIDQLFSDITSVNDVLEKSTFSIELREQKGRIQWLDLRKSLMDFLYEQFDVINNKGGDKSVSKDIYDAINAVNKIFDDIHGSGKVNKGDFFKELYLKYKDTFGDKSGKAEELEGKLTKVETILVDLEDKLHGRLEDTLNNVVKMYRGNKNGEDDLFHSKTNQFNYQSKDEFLNKIPILEGTDEYGGLLSNEGFNRLDNGGYPMRAYFTLTWLSRLHYAGDGEGVNKTPSYKQLHQAYRDVLKEDAKNNSKEKVSNSEQEFSMMHMLMQYYHPNNKFIEDELGIDGQLYVPGSLNVRGYASAGKTTQITRNYLKTIAKLSDFNSTNKMHILICAPTVALLNDHKTNLKDIDRTFGDIKYKTFYEFYKGNAELGKNDVMIFDEGSLMPEDLLKVIKSTEKTSDSITPKIFLSDDTQPSNKSYKSPILPVNRAGERTLPITQLYRSSVDQIHSLLNYYRMNKFGNGINGGKTTGVNDIKVLWQNEHGNIYGVRYLANSDSVIDSFYTYLHTHDATTDDALLIVETDEDKKKVEAYLDKNNMGKKALIKTLTYDLVEDSSICSGVASNNVFFAYDVNKKIAEASKSSTDQMNESRKAILGIGRARDYVVMVGDPTKSSKGIVHRADTDKLEGKGLEDKRTATIKRLNTIVGDKSDYMDRNGDVTSEVKNEGINRASLLTNPKDIIADADTEKKLKTQRDPKAKEDNEDKHSSISKLAFESYSGKKSEQTFNEDNKDRNFLLRNSMRIASLPEGERDAAYDSLMTEIDERNKKEGSKLPEKTIGFVRAFVRLYGRSGLQDILEVNDSKHLLYTNPYFKTAAKDGTISGNPFAVKITGKSADGRYIVDVYDVDFRKDKTVLNDVGPISKIKLSLYAAQLMKEGFIVNNLNVFNVNLESMENIGQSFHSGVGSIAFDELTDKEQKTALNMFGITKPDVATEEQLYNYHRDVVDDPKVTAEDTWTFGNDKVHIDRVSDIWEKDKPERYVWYNNNSTPERYNDFTKKYSKYKPEIIETFRKSADKFHAEKVMPGTTSTFYHDAKFQKQLFKTNAEGKIDNVWSIEHPIIQLKHLMAPLMENRPVQRIYHEQMMGNETTKDNGFKSSPTPFKHVVTIDMPDADIMRIMQDSKVREVLKQIGIDIPLKFEKEYEKGDYTKAIDLSNRIAKGENITSPEDLQLYTNYPKLMESLIADEDLRTGKKKLTDVISTDKAIEQFKQLELHRLLNEYRPENDFKSEGNRDNQIPDEKISSFLKEKYTNEDEVGKAADLLLDKAFPKDPNNDNSQEKLIAFNKQRLMAMYALSRPDGAEGWDAVKAKYRDVTVKEVSPGNAKLLGVKETENSIETIKKNAEIYGFKINDTITQFIDPVTGATRFEMKTSRDGFENKPVSVILDAGEASVEYIKGLIKGDEIKEISERLGELTKAYKEYSDGDIKKEDWLQVLQSAQSLVEGTEAYRFIDTNYTKKNKNYPGLSEVKGLKDYFYTSKGRTHLRGELKGRVENMINLLEKLAKEKSATGENEIKSMKLFKPVFNDITKKGTERYSEKNLDTKNLSTRFVAIGLPEMYIGAFADVNVKEETGKSNVQEPVKPIEEDIDNSFDKRIVNPITGYKFETIENAKSELRRIFGHQADDTRFLDNSLLDKGDIKRFGYVKNALITLATFGHERLVEANSPRHEAVHKLLAYVVKPEAAIDILNDTRRQMLAEGKTDTSFTAVHEYIADKFETRKVEPKSLLGKFVDWIRNILMRMGLFHPHTFNSFLDSIDYGHFSDVPIRNYEYSDIDFNRENPNKYNSPELKKIADDVFAGVANLQFVGDERLQGLLKKRSIISTEVSNDAFAINQRDSVAKTFEYAQKKFNEYNEKVSNKEDAKFKIGYRNVYVKDIDGNNAMKYKNDDGTAKSIHISEMTADDFADAMAGDYKTNANMINSYIIYQLGKDETLFKTLMTNLYPSFPVDSLFENAQERIDREERMREAGSTEAEIDAENTKQTKIVLNRNNELVNVLANRGIDMTTMLCTIKEMAPVFERAGNGEKVYKGYKEKTDGKSSYINERDITSTLMEAMNEVRKSGISMKNFSYDMLLNELKKIAVKNNHKGTVVASFLAEYGDTPTMKNGVSNGGIYHWLNMERTQGEEATLNAMSGKDTSGKFYGSIDEKNARMKLNQFRDMINGIQFVYRNVVPRSYISFKNGSMDIHSSSNVDIVKDDYKRSIAGSLLTEGKLNQEIVEQFTGPNAIYRVDKNKVEVKEGDTYRTLFSKPDKEDYLKIPKRATSPEDTKIFEQQKSLLIDNLRDLAVKFGMDDFTQETMRAMKINDITRMFHNFMIGLKVSAQLDNAYKSRTGRLNEKELSEWENKSIDEQRPDVITEHEKMYGEQGKNDYQLIKDIAARHKAYAQTADDTITKKSLGYSNGPEYFLPTIFFKDLTTVATATLDNTTNNRNNMYRNPEGEWVHTLTQASQFTDTWSNGSFFKADELRKDINATHEQGQIWNDSLSSGKNTFHNNMLNGYMRFDDWLSYQGEENDFKKKLAKNLSQRDLFNRMLDSTYDAVFDDDKGITPVILSPFADKPLHIWIPVLHNDKEGHASQLYNVSGDKMSINQKQLVTMVDDLAAYYDLQRRQSLNELVTHLRNEPSLQSELGRLDGITDHNQKVEVLNEIMSTMEPEVAKRLEASTELSKIFHYKFKDGKYEVGNALTSSQVMFDHDFHKDYNGKSDVEKYHIVKNHAEDMYINFVDIMNKAGVRLNDRYSKLLDVAEVGGDDEINKVTKSLINIEAQHKEERKNLYSIANLFYKPESLTEDQAALHGRNYNELSYFQQGEKLKGENLKKYNNETETISKLLKKYNSGKELTDEEKRILYQPIKKEVEQVKKREKTEKDLVKQSMKDSHYMMKSKVEGESNTWNPLLETIFWNHLTVNEAMHQIDRGSPSFYDEMGDFTKRAAGLIAPRSVFNMFDEMPKNSKAFVMKDIKLFEQLFTDKGISAFDAMSVLNPVSHKVMVRAAGLQGVSPKGPLKTVNFGYVPATKKLTYLKHAQFPITWYKFRDSKPMQDLMHAFIGDANWTTYESRMMKSEMSWNKSIREMANAYAIAVKTGVDHGHIDYLVHESGYKSGAHGLIDYDKIDESKPLDIDNFTFNPANRDNHIIISNEGLGKQIDTVQDTYDVKKSIMTQLLYIAGIMPSDSAIIDEINSSMSAFANMAIDAMKGLGDKKSVDKFLHGLNRNYIAKSNENIKNIELLSDDTLGADAMGRKNIQNLVTYVNEYLKPSMPGQSFVQEAGFMKYYEDGSGLIHVAHDLELPNDASDKDGYTKRRLQPALYMVKEGNTYRRVADKKEFQDHIAAGTKVYYRAMEVAMPFNDIKKFGISKLSTLAKVMQVGKEDSKISLYDARKEYNDDGTAKQKSFNDYKDLLTTHFKDIENDNEIYNQFSSDVAGHIKSKVDKTGAKTRFDIKKAIINEAAKYYDDLNKALDVIVVRIPTANGSSASVGRIVSFLNDSANTIIIPPEKNILDGSDQDSDQLQVFFRSTDNVGAVNTTDKYELNQNKVFGAIEKFYYNQDNHPLILNTIDYDPIVRKAREIDSGSVSKPNEVGSSVKVGSQNRSSNVGLWADIGQFVARTLAIPDNVKSTVFNENMRLYRDPLLIPDTINTNNALINAATDIAKLEGALGKVYFNEATAPIITGMMMYRPGGDNLLNEMFSKITDNTVMKYVSDRVLASISVDPNVSRTNAWEVLSSILSDKKFTYDNNVYYVHDAEGKAKLEQERINIANDTKLSAEEKTINLDRINSLFLHNIDRQDVEELLKYAYTGEQANRTMPIFRLIQGLPNQMHELVQLKETIEKNMGLPLKDFLSKVGTYQKENFAPTTQLEWLAKERMKYTLQDGKKSEEESQIRGTFNMASFVAMQPNLVSNLTALDTILDTVYKSMPVEKMMWDGDDDKSIINTVRKIATMEFDYPDKTELFQKMSDELRMGMFLSDNYKNFNFTPNFKVNGKDYNIDDGKFLTSKGSNFNMSNGHSRTWFALVSPEWITNLKKAFPENTFLQNLKTSYTRWENTPYIEFRDSMHLTPEEKSRVQASFKQLEPWVQEPIRIYNLITNGFGYKNGSYNEMTDTTVERKYDSWSKGLDIDKTRDRLLEDNNKLLVSGLAKYEGLLEMTKVGMKRKALVFRANRDTIKGDAKVYLRQPTAQGNEFEDYHEISMPYYPWINNFGDNMTYTEKPVANFVEFKKLIEIQKKRDEITEYNKKGKEVPEPAVFVTNNRRISSQAGKEQRRLIETSGKSRVWNKFEIADGDTIVLRDGGYGVIQKASDKGNDVTIAPIAYNGHVLASAVSYDGRSMTSDAIKFMTDKLQRAFPNVRMDTVTNETALNRDLLSYIHDGIVYFNTDKVEPGTMLHELVGHIFVDALESKNPDLYSAFQKQAIDLIDNKSDVVQRLLKANAYSNLSRPLLIKEVIANLIGFTSHDVINKFFEGKGIELSNAETKELYDTHKTIIGKVWDWIKTQFQKLFNITSDVTNKIHPDMTIQEFAKNITEHILNEEGPLSMISSAKYGDMMKAMGVYSLASDATAIEQFKTLGEFGKFMRYNNINKYIGLTNDADKAKYWNVKIDNNNGILDSKYTGEEINFNGMDASEREFKIKEIIKSYNPDDSETQSKFHEYLTTHGGDNKVSKTLFGGSEDRDNVPAEVLDKTKMLIDYDQHNTYVKYEDLAKHPEYKNLFNENFANATKPLVSVYKGNDGTLFVSLYNFTKNPMGIKVASDHKTIYGRVIKDSEAKIQNMRIGNSEGNMRLLELGMIAQDMLQRNPNVQIKDIGILQVRRNGVNESWFDPYFFSQEMRQMASDRRFRAKWDPETLGKVMDTSTFKPFSMNDEKLLRSRYGEQDNCPTSLKRKIGMMDQLSTNELKHLYSGRIIDILNGRNMSQLNSHEMDEVKRLLNTSLVIGKTPLADWQMNSPDNINSLQTLMTPGMDMPNEYIMRLRQIQLDVSNAIVTDAGKHIDDLQKVYKFFIDKYKSEHPEVVVTERILKEYTHKFYDRVIVKNTDASGKQYNSNFIYFSKDDKEDPLHAKLARDNNIADDVLAQGKATVDKMNKLMVDMYRHYRWIQGNYKPFERGSKPYEEMSDVEVLEDLKKHSGYKEGMLPVINMTTGELAGTGKFAEAWKKNFKRVTSSFTMFDEMTDMMKADAEMADKIQDAFMYQWGIDDNDNNTPLGGKARLSLLGLTQNLDGGYDIEDAKKNGNISKDLETIMNYFTLSTQRKIHYESEMLPLVNATKVLLYDLKVNKGLNVGNIDKYIDLWTYGVIKGMRKLSDAQIAGLKLDPVFSEITSITRTMALFGNVNVATMIGITNGMRGFIEGIANHFVPERGLPTGMEMAKASALFFSDHAKAVELAHMYQVVNWNERDLISSRARIMGKKHPWSDFTGNWMLWSVDTYGRTVGMIAQMLHDGSWDAHKYNKNTSEITYDQKLDKQWSVKDGEVLRKEVERVLANQTGGLNAEGKMSRGYDIDAAKKFAWIGDKYIVGAQNSKVKAMLSQYMVGRMVNMFHTFMMTMVENAFQKGMWVPEAGRRVIKYDINGQPTAQYERLFVEGYTTSVVKAMKMLWMMRDNPKIFEDMKKNDPEKWQVMKYNLIKAGTMVAMFVAMDLLYNGLVQDKDHKDKLIPQTRIGENVKYAFEGLFVMPHILKAMDSPWGAIDLLKNMVYTNYGQPNINQLIKHAPVYSDLYKPIDQLIENNQ